MNDCVDRSIAIATGSGNGRQSVRRVGVTPLTRRRRARAGAQIARPDGEYDEADQKTGGALEAAVHFDHLRETPDPAESAGKILKFIDENKLETLNVGGLSQLDVREAMDLRWL
jgi:hypothetical protein